MSSLLTATLAIGLFLLPVSLAMRAPQESLAIIGPVVIICVTFGTIVLLLSIFQGEPSFRPKSRWKTAVWSIVMLGLPAVLAAVIAVVVAQAIAYHFL